MILPARYGRLWSVVAILLICIFLLIFFQSGASTDYLRRPGFGLSNDQEKLEPEEPAFPHTFRPAAPVIPSPEPTTSTDTTAATTTSTTTETTAVPFDEAVDVENDVSRTTQNAAETTLGDAAVVVQSSGVNAAEPTSSAYFEGAGRLGQPGIQPEPSTPVNAPVATLADGGAVVIESISLLSNAPSPTASSTSPETTATTTGLTQADNAEEITLANGGALGQPGIQPGTSTSEPPVTRIASGAAVIVEAPASSAPASTSAAPIRNEVSKLIVMGRLSNEDTDWVDEELPDWQNAIYYTDLEENVESPTGLRTRVNKAREAMPYLTYIIDNYPTFPDVVVFMHPHKQAWHTDAKGHNAVTMLQDLQPATVIDRGFVNLRCNPEVGCPDEILPFRDPPDPNKHAEQAFPYVYSHFFNASATQMREEIRVIGTPCCAQFAVSSAQLGKRSKEDYEMYRRYLEETEYDDATIGRVMEYMWHMIFFKDPVLCEDMFDCWCAVYGKCTPRDWRDLLDGQ